MLESEGGGGGGGGGGGAPSGLIWHPWMRFMSVDTLLDADWLMWLT